MQSMVEYKDLNDFLKNGKDWELIETNVDGVKISKLPATKSRGAKLSVVVNPNNTKRKGLFLTSFDQYLEFREALEQDKIAETLTEIDQINGEESKKKIKL